MSTYPNLNQFQEYARKSQRLEGKGFFLQKVLTSYMQDKPVFDNLFIKGDLLNQETQLSTQQFEALKANLPAIAGKTRELAEQNEMKKNLEMQVSGESEEDRMIDNLAEFKVKDFQMQQELKRGGIEFK
jgi:hypothetical protein